VQAASGWRPWSAGERESRLSALQRLALVDAAASWLSEPNGGTNWRMPCLARRARPRSPPSRYLALITPPVEPEDHPEGIPRSGRFSWVSVAGQGSREA
jgi:hypothetical protein